MQFHFIVDIKKSYPCFVYYIFIYARLEVSFQETIIKRTKGDIEWKYFYPFIHAWIAGVAEKKTANSPLCEIIKFKNYVSCMGIFYDSFYVIFSPFLSKKRRENFPHVQIQFILFTHFHFLELNYFLSSISWLEWIFRFCGLNPFWVIFKIRLFLVFE